MNSTILFLSSINTKLYYKGQLKTSEEGACYFSENNCQNLFTQQRTESPSREILKRTQLTQSVCWKSWIGDFFTFKYLCEEKMLH